MVLLAKKRPLLAKSHSIQKNKKSRKPSVFKGFRHCLWRSRGDSNTRPTA